MMSAQAVLSAAPIGVAAAPRAAAPRSSAAAAAARRVAAAPRPGCSVAGAVPSRPLAARAGSRRAATTGSRARSAAVAALGAAVAASADAKGDRPVILVAEKLGKGGIDLLKAYGTVVEAFDMTPADLLAKISLCDALIVRSATKVSKEVFAAGAGRLKVVGRAGVGIDNVDLVAATEAGVLVVNAPTANTVAAAEHGIALLCALARFVPQADASMKSGKWERPKYTGASLVAKTLAIMGFGKVGTEVARRAKGLGMTVIAYDPFAPAERAKAMGVELVSFDDALARGDFFSLHMPLTPSTEKLFNDATFAKMKKGARIINVARGGVIDDDALVRALDSKQVAAAALDVFEIEPPAKDNPLVMRPDVICTPHLGASTVEAQEGVAVEIAEAVIGALNGELAATAVNAPMVPAEMLNALAPFIGLAEKLGRIALQLVDASSGLSEVVLTYKGSNKEDLDTRLLRANVIKGLVQRDTTASVNLVNADTLAKSRGIKFVEIIEPASVSGGSDLLTSMSITVRGCRPVMKAAADANGAATVEGGVRSGVPWLSRIGTYDLSLAIEGNGLLLYANMDQPGIIGRVGTLLAKEGVNIAFMAVARSGPRERALAALGVDGRPPDAAVAELASVPAITEVAYIEF